MSGNGEQDRVREMAERVARRLDARAGGGEASSAQPAPDDITALREGLTQIQRRLAHIESHLADGQERAGARPQKTEPRADATPSRSMWLSGTYVPAVTSSQHPSQEKFGGIGEAVAELVDFFESEKTCNVEPGNKPCDHCGMCSSRGF